MHRAGVESVGEYRGYHSFWPILKGLRYPTWGLLDNIPLFGEYQLLKAADSLWNEKEPNRDGIPAELMKVVAHPYFKLLLNMLICCLSEVVFYRRRILRQ